MKTTRKRTKLQTRLILAFLITSMIPLIIVNIFLYYNTSGIVRSNVDELAAANLDQTRNGLDIWLESYQDILFQIYMNDDIVKTVEEINEGKELSINRKQLRRTLRGLFYTKEYIKSITIITQSGEIIFYDLLTGSMTKNSWLDNFGMTPGEIYDTVSMDNMTHIFSTREAYTSAQDTAYLFHLGHRIIDYKKVDKQLGIVMVSVDEQMLREACSVQDGGSYFNFIVDREGRLVSYTQDALLGKKILDWTEEEKSRREAYREFLETHEGRETGNLSIYTVYDDKFQWEIVRVSDQNTVVERLKAQQRLIVVVLILSLAALTAVILLLTQSLTGSLRRLVSVMERAGTGELSARMKVDGRTPREVEVISQQFNRMLERLGDSMEKEKNAIERQKSAEIAALEAQINPHFIYNTLDTINWMAIDRDEYEISSSINALAAILRYGINQSNEIVTVRQEEEWLKQYLFLQQTRLKNTFVCEIHVDAQVKEYHIHKLLLQPFVENAILHGFEGVDRTHRLSVQIGREEDDLHIEIYDNGKGIPKQLVETMNRGEFPKCTEKNHIGMENAITRIGMYYGERAAVRIESEEDVYTRILITIPVGAEYGQ